VYVVIVQLNVKPDRIDEFLQHTLHNATNARSEPGCLRFDVHGTRPSRRVSLFTRSTGLPTTSKLTRKRRITRPGRKKCRTSSRSPASARATTASRRKMGSGSSGRRRCGLSHLRWVTVCSRTDGTLCRPLPRARCSRGNGAAGGGRQEEEIEEGDAVVDLHGPESFTSAAMLTSASQPKGCPRKRWSRIRTGRPGPVFRRSWRLRRSTRNSGRGSPFVIENSSSTVFEGEIALDVSRSSLTSSSSAWNSRRKSGDCCGRTSRFRRRGSGRLRPTRGRSSLAARRRPVRARRRGRPRRASAASLVVVVVP
jgi:hypothetical protein